MVFERLWKRGSRRGVEVGRELDVVSKDEQGESNSLLQSESFVYSLGGSPNTVQAERVNCAEKLDIPTAHSVRPCQVDIQIPADFAPGKLVPVQGPQGLVHMTMPEGVEAGQTLRYNLRASPEYRVEVPPGAKPGASVTFTRADGAEIAIAVPPNLGPGDRFEVTPPVVMVLVPAGCKPGDSVVFSTQAAADGGFATRDADLLMAVVPAELQLGVYFAARLPQPGGAKGPGRRDLDAVE
mmetsp:Transcript_172/g.624  ORF Transcript_172/g.624 Transcript_172/m.624 type:complete len:239 (-) Transcript_172:127-843(-)